MLINIMILLTPVRLILVVSVLIIVLLVCPYGTGDLDTGGPISSNLTTSSTDSYSDPNQSSHYLVETCSQNKGIFSSAAPA